MSIDFSEKGKNRQIFNEDSAACDCYGKKPLRLLCGEGDKGCPEAINSALSFLPKRIKEKILHQGSLRRGFFRGLSEIRLSASGGCFITVCGENIPLYSTLTEEEAAELFARISGGSLYSHRDAVRAGYIPLEGGVRVGICGEVRYDNGNFSGLVRPDGFVFRIPGGKSTFGEEVFSRWINSGMPNMLIFSPPGGGKTSLIRELARLAGGGGRPHRCVVVDERREFISEDYRGLSVDILKGYKKVSGIEIAKRSLSADVIIIDELSAREAEALSSALTLGIRVIATIHAEDIDELRLSRDGEELIRTVNFRMLVGLKRSGANFECDIKELAADGKTYAQDPDGYIDNPHHTYGTAVEKQEESPERRDDVYVF